MSTCCRSCIGSIPSCYWPCNNCCRPCCYCCCTKPPPRLVKKKRSRFGDIFKGLTPNLEDFNSYQKKRKKKFGKRLKKKKRAKKGEKDRSSGKGKKKDNGEKSSNRKKTKKQKENKSKPESAKSSKREKGTKEKNLGSSSQGSKSDEAPGGKHTEKSVGEYGDMKSGIVEDSSSPERPATAEGDVYQGGKWKADNECRPNQLIKCPQTCTLRPKKCMINQIGPCNEACLKGLPYIEPQSMYPGNFSYQSNGNSSGGVYCGPEGIQMNSAQYWRNMPGTAVPQAPRTAPLLYCPSTTPNKVQFCPQTAQDSAGNQRYKSIPQTAPPFYNAQNQRGSTQYGVFCSLKDVYNCNLYTAEQMTPFSPNFNLPRYGAETAQMVPNYFQGGDGAKTFVPPCPSFSSYKCNTCGKERKIYQMFNGQHLPP